MVGSVIVLLQGTEEGRIYLRTDLTESRMIGSKRMNVCNLSRVLKDE